MSHLIFLRRRMACWLLAVAGMLLVTVSAHATTCSYRDINPYGSAAANLAAPLTISALTIGRDVPLGTVVYEQTVQTRSFEINCVGDTVTPYTWFPTTPRPLSSWAGSPYPNAVYETGVPGLGVALLTNGLTLPWTTTVANCAGTPTTSCNWRMTGPITIRLIKIGAISPGILQATNLPTVRYDYRNANTLTISNYRFTGSIRIVSQTCSTPDVTVALGEHKVSEFPSVGSATPWQSFNIRLQNCPAFYGRSASLRNTDSATGWVESNKTLNANVLQFSLDATNGTAAIYPGTVRLSPTTSGPASATGIGVQIFDDSLTAVKFATLMPSNITPTDTSGASYTIPLQARYIRITGALAPGPANAAVMFTINYQ